MADLTTAPSGSPTPEATPTPAPTPAPAEATPTPAPVAEAEITESAVRELVRKEPRSQKTREITRKFREQGFAKLRNPQPAPAATPDPSTPAESLATPAPAATPEAKRYVTEVAGQKVELKDPDGWLGHKDAEGIKKALANKEAYNKRLQEYQKRDEERAIAAERKATELEARIKAFEVTPAPAAPNAAPTQPPVVLKEIPKRPEGIATDPIEWTTHQSQQMAEYQVAYDAAVRENLLTLQSRTQAAGVNPNDPVLQKIQTDLQALTQMRNEIEFQRRQAELERTEAKMWDGFHTFQSQHSDEYSTPTALKELHKQIAEDGNKVVVMDQIALANGIQRPVTDSEQEWIAYRKSKAEMTDKLLAGDPQVAQSVEAAGIALPQGFKEYFEVSAKINHLSSERNRLIKDGVLGPNSSLHDAWRQTNEGTLTQQTVALERSARADGAKAVVDALKEHKTDHAVNVPPAASETGAPPADLRAEIERVVAFAKAHPRDPQAKKQMAELRGKLGLNIRHAITS